MTLPGPEQFGFVRIQLETIGRHPVANVVDAVHLKSPDGGHHVVTTTLDI